jgi:hypothetical protein
MRRFRYSLRRLLAAVLLVGVLIWVYIQKQRSVRFSSFSEDARQAAEKFKQLGSMYTRDATNGYMLRPDGTRLKVSAREAEEMRVWATDCRTLAAFCDKLCAKYQRAARSPWFSVEPDEKPEPVVAEWLSGNVPRFSARVR